MQDRLDIEHSAIEGPSPFSADALNEAHDSEGDSPLSRSANFDPPLNIDISETDQQSLNVATIANAQDGDIDELSIIEGQDLWPQIKAKDWSRLITKFVFYQ